MPCGEVTSLYMFVVVISSSWWSFVIKLGDEGEP